MHDIGKLIVPNQLLNKPGRLTESEFARVRRHEGVSVELLRRIDFLAPIAGRHDDRGGHRGRRGFGARRAGDHPRRRRLRRHDVDPLLPQGAEPGDGVRRAPRAARASQFNADCVEALIRAIEARDEHYGAGYEVDVHEWDVAPPDAGTGSAGLGDVLPDEHSGATPAHADGPARLARGSEAVNRRRGSRCSPAVARRSRSGADLAQPGTKWSALALIGGAIAAGELIELRPPFRAALPISFAYMVVLARRASVADAALVLVVALLATFLVRSEPTTAEGRLALLVERFAEGLAAVVVFHGIDRAFDDPTARGQRARRTRRSAATAPLVVAEIARMVRDAAASRSRCTGRIRRCRARSRARRSWASATWGSAARGGMGLWGPLVFTIPLLACVVLVRAPRRGSGAPTTRPSVRSAPRPSSAASSATGTPSGSPRSSLAIGAELGLSRHELAHLETAALLHHLGQVCLDEPDDGRSVEPAAVAAVGCSDPAQHAAARAGGRHHRGRDPRAPRAEQRSGRRCSRARS